MAEVKPTHLKDPPIPPNVVVYKWETMGNDDTGLPIEVPGAADKTVTISGSFGGATVTLQGSNDNSTWFTLTDPQGTDISITTTAAMSLVSENPRYIRAITAGGDGTIIDVIIVGKVNA